MEMADFFHIMPVSKPSVGAVGKTGTWRVFKPIIDHEKCTRCGLCWIYCPDESIELKEDDTPKINYDFCKGCGICSDVCPVKAIKMEAEEIG